jgi:hypothetical protein
MAAVPPPPSPEVVAEALQVVKAIDEICAKSVEVAAIFSTEVHSKTAICFAI